MIVNNYRALQFMRDEMGEHLEPGIGSGAAPDRHRRHPRRSERSRAIAAARRRPRRRLRSRRRQAGSRPSPGRATSGTHAAALRLRQRRSGERAIRPPGGPRDPAALLPRLRPSIRGRKRAYCSDSLLVVDAGAGLLVGRVPIRLQDPARGAGPVRPRVSRDRDRRRRHDLLPDPPAAGHRAGHQRDAQLSGPQDRRNQGGRGTDSRGGRLQPPAARPALGRAPAPRPKLLLRRPRRDPSCNPRDGSNRPVAPGRAANC